MGTYILPVTRSPYYHDEDGVLSVLQDTDATDTHVLDFTDVLASGETVSSIATTVSGVTLDSSALATPNVTLTVTGTGGEIETKATTSASRVIVQRLRFYPAPGGWADNGYA